MRVDLKWLSSLLGAVLLSAGLLVLCMPLGEQGYLGWIAFVPLIRVTRGRGFLPALLGTLGVIFAGAFLSITGWLYHDRDPLGSASWVYTGFGIFGFSACLAIGAWGDRSSARLPIWWFAGFATLCESLLLTKLPAHLALSQYRNVVVLQAAAVGGIWLVSFLIWSVNFYLATLPLKRLGLIVAVLLPVSFLTSLIRVRLSGPTADIAVIQIGDPDEKSVARMQRQVSLLHPAFTIWPEFAGIPFTFAGDPVRLRHLSVEPGSSPIITSYQDDFQPLPHNASALFTEGATSEIYWKRRLFGEESKMHTPGDRAVSAPFARGRVGLNICFDSCYPEIIRDTASIPGTNLISLPSIDPDASNHFIAAMHASYSPFRCAEEGVAMVKSDGLAYSSFVDSFGQTLKELPPGEQVSVQSMPLQTHWTPYRQFGDWFLWLLGGLEVWAIVRAVRSREPASQVNASP